MSAFYMPSITGRYEKTKRPIVERIKSHAYLLVKNALRASALVGSPSTFSSRNFLVAALKDPDFNKTVYDAMNVTELEIVYMEGESFAKTGVEALDALLREKYNKKFEITSASYHPAILTIWLVKENGGVEPYYNYSVHVTE